MPGGPLFPSSAVPDTSGEVFPVVHAAGGGYREGLGVTGGPTADRIWHLEFDLPPALPSGVCRLVLVVVADAASGAAKVNPKWTAIDPSAGDNAFTASRLPEGTTTLTWSAGHENDDKLASVVLDATSLTPGGTVVMDLVFEASGWTLAVESTWKAYLIWS